MSLKAKCRTSIREQRSRATTDIVAVTDKPRMKKIWLNYQWQWIKSKNQIDIAEKSRQVGISEAEAYRAVDDCIHDRLDTYYSTTTLPVSKTFIRKCARWARGINKAYFVKTGQHLISEAQIGTYRIEFLNGRFIEAISSESKNTRGLERAVLVKDEAAFDLHLSETLEAMKAIIIRGVGRLRLISTHWGDDTEFYRQVEEIKKKPYLGRVHRITFMDAIAEGLYKNICEINGTVWTPEGEKEFIRQVYETFGESASQELDVIARTYSSKDILRREYFHVETYESYELVNALKVRYFDLAGSVKEYSFYTASLQLAIVGSKIVITDIQAEKKEAVERDEWIESIITTDDPGTFHLLEEEGGSHGSGYIESMKRRCNTSHVDKYRPSKNKLIRLLPTVPMLQSRELVILDRMYLIDGQPYTVEQVIALICRVNPLKPIPLVQDICDCLSGAFDFIMDRGYYSSWIAD